jgi:hypothetical protein
MTGAVFLTVVSLGLLGVLFVVGDGADGGGVHGALSRRGVVWLAASSAAGLVAMLHLGPLGATPLLAWAMAAVSGGVVLALGRLGLRWLVRTDGARPLTDADLLAADGRWILPPTSAQPVGLVRLTSGGAVRELRARWTDVEAASSTVVPGDAPVAVDAIDADGVLRVSPR